MSELNNIDKLKPKNGILSFSDDPVLQPSEKVWVDINKKLKNKKKLNVLWIILPFLITFSSAVIFLSSQNKDTDHLFETTSFSNVESSNNSLNSNAEFASIEDNIEKNIHQTLKNDKEIEKEINSANIFSDVSSNNHNEIQSTDVNSNILDVNSNTANSNSGNTINSNSGKDFSAISITNHVISANVVQIAFDKNVVGQNESQFEKANVNSEPEQKREVLIIPSISNRWNNIFSFGEKINDLSMKVESFERKSKNLFWGFQVSRGLTSYNKPKNIQGSEIIQSSIYKNSINLGLVIQYKLSDNFSLSFIPSLNVNKLNTNYDLNVKYDYNTETINENEKVNQFSHSLPTDQGNISTKMLVTRAIDSPVAHNENINIDLQVEQTLYSVGNSLNLNYHFNSFSKGFYVFSSVNPEFIVTTNARSATYHSNHTHVKEHSVEIKPESYSQKFGLYSSLGVGYKMNVPSIGALQSSIEYKKGLNNSVYSQGLILNLGISKSF